MFVPCEIMVQKVLPVLRANLARSLVEEHGCSQKKAASFLGLTQPAVSFYLNEVRGKSSVFRKDKDLGKLVDDIALRLSRNCLSEKEKIDSFCTVCMYVRSTKLICDFHGISRKEGCTLCFAPSSGMPDGKR